MTMENNFNITRGHPFENEWIIQYDIFDEDKIDPTIPFVITNKSNNEEIILYFNYGMSIMKYNNEEVTKLVISIFDTDIFDNGEYSYEYLGKTLGRKEIGHFHGKITVSSEDSDKEPTIKRQARPWDFLKSKAPGEAGERASEEKQDERMSICETCPSFIKLTTQCKECGCIMKMKTKLEQAVCPLGKW